jgi:hypothetical protein
VELATLDHDAMRSLVAEDARRKASLEASAELRKEENLQFSSDLSCTN